jgi:hypothetical protein
MDFCSGKGRDAAGTEFGVMGVVLDAVGDGGVFAGGEPEVKSL